MPISRLPAELLAHIARYLSLVQLHFWILASRDFSTLLTDELHLEALALDVEEQTPLRSHVVAAYRSKLTTLKCLLQKTPDIDCRLKNVDPSKYANLLPEGISDDTAIINLEGYSRPPDPPNFGLTTLLHVVSGLGQGEIIRLVLDKGGDSTMPDYLGRMPLHKASFRGHTAAIKLLIDAGASISSFTKAPDIRYNWLTNSARRTALHYAAWQGHLPAVRLLIAAGADVSVLESGGWGWSALMYATNRDDPELVKQLVDSGADVLCRGLNQVTPLHQARSTGVARLLLNKGGRDLYRGANVDGNPPVWTLYPSAPQDLALFLVEFGTGIIPPFTFHYTLLHKAAKAGHDQVVAALLKAQKKLVLDRDIINNETALHAAARNTSGAKCAKILIDAGVDIHAATKWQKATALHLAASNPQGEECARILIDAGVDVSAVSKGGDTALHLISAGSGGREVTKMLLKASTSRLNSRNFYGCTALHSAATRCNEVMVEQLLQAGADVSVQDNDGANALFRTVGNENVVKQLIKAGIDVNHQSNNGTTALHWKAWSEKEEIVELLLQSGAKPDLPDKDGDIPLHQAAGGGNEDVVNLFLLHGVNPSTQNSRGTTALLISVRLALQECLSRSKYGPRPAKKAVLKSLITDGITVSSQSISHLPDIQRNHVAVSRRLLTVGADTSLRDSGGQSVQDLLGLS